MILHHVSHPTSSEALEINLMYKNKIFITVIVILSAVLQGCLPEDEAIWVTILPIQCLGNPWEVDWLEKHDDDTAAWSAMSNAEQIEVFVDYYGDLGIPIREVDQTFSDNDHCDGCACPRGDRLFCLIDEKDLDTMLGLGFELE